jgi:hypothetical protein
MAQVLTGRREQMRLVAVRDHAEVATDASQRFSHCRKRFFLAAKTTRFLDNAWAKDDVNIVTVVAPGRPR